VRLISVERTLSLFHTRSGRGRPPFLRRNTQWEPQRTRFFMTCRAHPSIWKCHGRSKWMSHLDNPARAIGNLLPGWRCKTSRIGCSRTCRKFFPNQCDASGAGRLRESVQQGIHYTSRHRITDKRNVCKYIDLTIVFSRDFDASCRWAREILGQCGDPGARMQNLLSAAKLQLADQ
jgi:hypothetical protein